MPLTLKENWFRTVRRENPAWMPYSFYFGRASWLRFGKEQEEVVLRHPQSWPTYREGDYLKEMAQPWPEAEDPTRDFVDDWGVVWRTTQYGFVGTVVDAPLADDAALASFTPPQIETYNGGMRGVDFSKQPERLADVKTKGYRAGGSLDHGFFLLRLEYLRGFENLMCDLMDPGEEFQRLFDTVHRHNVAAVRNWIAAGAESVGLPEDLGGQDRSLIGPRLFRKWALPCYKELHALAHAAGLPTYFHCDGNIMDIADQILEINPSVFNPQDRANGVENLAAAFKGHICLDLDFDRQYLLPFGTPQEIAEWTEYVVKTLGSREGGLMIKVEVRGDVPPQNLDAVATALEKWHTYWFD